MKTIWQVAGVAALIAAATPMAASAAVEGLPPAHRAGGVSYVSGGVGAGEADRFKAAFDHYPLVVEVFRRDGARDEYTADARVKVADRMGRTVLDERTDGPFTLVRLPPGNYRVSAAMHGQREAERSVHVTPDGHAKAVFVFPERRVS